MGKIDLTIIIPAFRCAKYLPSTIVSALRCCHSKILIAEDCSGDDTLTIARSWRDKYPQRIRLIENHVNLGMTQNWQNTMKLVETDFALKLDGDDILVPGYAESALQLMQRESEVSIVAGAAQIIQAEDMIQSENEVCTTTPFNAAFNTLHGTDACRFILHWEPYPCSSSTMYRMNNWREIGGFDTRLNWCSDREIWFRMARQGSIAFSPLPAVFYRQLTSSVTSKHRNKDIFCYELDIMFRSARKIWPETELAVDFYPCFKTVTKAFAGSAWRAIRWHKYAEVPSRLFHAVSGLSNLINP